MSHPKLATVRSGYGGRGYRIPGRQFEDAKGKKQQLVYPSVTTVLSKVAKPALMQWVADQTAAFAVANISHLMSRSEESGWGFLRFFWSREPDLADPLRNHYIGVRDDAAEMGTNIHEWIEAELDGIMPYPATDSVEMEQMIVAFKIWLQHHEIVPVNAEFTVVNDTLGIAGTADADWWITCLHEGPCLGQGEGEAVRTLVDLKSSRHTWDENGMQLAALGSGDVVMREVPEGTVGALRHERTVDGVKERSWWVEDAMPSFDRYALLHIRPNDLDTEGNVIPAFCILKDRTDDIDLFLEGFEGALGVARMQYKLKQRESARKKLEA